MALDFLLEDEGSYLFITPLTPRAFIWCQTHLLDSAPVLGNSYLIEHLHADEIIDALFYSSMSFEYRIDTATN